MYDDRYEAPPHRGVNYLVRVVHQLFVLLALVLQVAVYRELHPVADGHLQLVVLLDALFQQPVGQDVIWS